MREQVLSLVPEGTALWWAATAFAVAVLVIGIAKSGFGGGIGILAVPLTASALSASVAVGVLLPILIAADLVAVWQHHRHPDGRHLRWTLLGAVFGIVAGTAIIVALGKQERLETGLSLVVGGVCLLFVAIQCYRLVGGKVPRVPDTPASGIAAGGLAGVVSTLVHGAGPIMSIYLLEHRLPKRVLVATLVFFFWIVNLMKLPSYIGYSIITPRTLLVSALAIPLVPVGSLLGMWMHKRVAERPFTLIMYLGAAAAGAHMLYRAVQ